MGVPSGTTSLLEANYGVFDGRSEDEWMIRFRLRELRRSADVALNWMSNIDPVNCVCVWAGDKLLVRSRLDVMQILGSKH